MAAAGDQAGDKPGLDGQLVKPMWRFTRVARARDATGKERRLLIIVHAKTSPDATHRVRGYARSTSSVVMPMAAFRLRYSGQESA